MIIETIELLIDDSHELLTIEKLQSRLNAGEFDDILISHPFLIMTNKGLCLIKKDETGIVLQPNAVVDLSDYVTNEHCALKSDIPSLDGYATEDFVIGEINKINIPNVDSFITENDVNNILVNKSYAYTNDLHFHDNKLILDIITSEKIAAWDASSNRPEINLTEYVKSSDLDKYALKTDIPSLSSYATESFVTTEIEKINIPDVSNFITNETLSNYTLKSEIPTFEFDVDGTLIVTINGVSNRYAPIATA